MTSSITLLSKLHLLFSLARYEFIYNDLVNCFLSFFLFFFFLFFSFFLFMPMISYRFSTSSSFSSSFFFSTSSFSSSSFFSSRIRYLIHCIILFVSSPPNRGRQFTE
uniref:Uncharacterized protein n=1 Tax=Cacopsylla melanoneura TaxID=428564 RepID=A0A8D8YE03_9HEMI